MSELLIKLMITLMTMMLVRVIEMEFMQQRPCPAMRRPVSFAGDHQVREIPSRYELMEELESSDISYVFESHPERPAWMTLICESVPEATILQNKMTRVVEAMAPGTALSVIVPFQRGEGAHLFHMRRDVFLRWQATQAIPVEIQLASHPGTLIVSCATEEEAAWVVNRWRQELVWIIYDYLQAQPQALEMESWLLLKVFLQLTSWTDCFNNLDLLNSLFPFVYDRKSVQVSEFVLQQFFGESLQSRFREAEDSFLAESAWCPELHRPFDRAVLSAADICSHLDRGL